MAVITKAKRVVGKNLYLRDICEEDAKFIFDLRTDPVKSRYLSGTSGRVEDQVNWIRSYREKKDQAYFIVCDKDGNRLGCVRIYDPIGNSYCWGSWLMLDGLGPLVAIESALLVYSYGVSLGFSEARIDVRKGNESVWKFHEQFAGAELVKEDNLDRFYVVKAERISPMLKKYSEFLTCPLVVEQLR
jgi:RimJ/RimL family protein N-acetyltransferase